MRVDRYKIIFGALACAGLGFFASRAGAIVPTTDALSYSGLLTNGGVAESVTRTMQVLAYTQETGGTAACVSALGPVELVNGHFKVPMEDCRAAFAANPGLWIEVQVETNPIGPRTFTRAVPYAIEAEKAHAASGALLAELNDLRAELTAVQADLQTQADRRAVSVQYRTSSGQTLSDTLPTIVNFDTPMFDTTPAAVTTGANWRFTAPFTGTYMVAAMLEIVSPTNALVVGANGAYFVVQTPNAIDPIPCEVSTTNPFFATMSGTTLVKLDAGDDLQIVIRQYLAADAHLGMDNRVNYVSIKLVD